MKHIASDNIVSISADSENANFPATNLNDEHPKRIFKTDDNINFVSLTVGVVGGASDVMIANTNAASATIFASDPNEISWGDDDSWGWEEGATTKNLVEDPGFVTETPWTLGSGWTIGSETLTTDGTIFAGAQNDVVLDASKTYLAFFDLTAAAGDAGYVFQLNGNWFGSDDVGVGMCTFTGYTYLRFTTSGSAGRTATIDNVFVIETSELDTWANVALEAPTITVEQNVGANSMWISLASAISVPVDLVVTLFGPGGISLYAGVIRANIAETYGHDPRYGLQESREDFSILAENSNGSRYYNKRDIVRSFNLSALLSRPNAQLLIDSFDELGQEPSAWKLTSEDSSDWVVFGRFTGPPIITHSYPNHSMIEWAITEVL